MTPADLGKSRSVTPVLGDSIVSLEPSNSVSPETVKGAMSTKANRVEANLPWFSLPTAIQLQAEPVKKAKQLGSDHRGD
jgi:hypothetical protein